MSRDDFENGPYEGEGSDEIGLPGFLFDPMGVVRRRWPWMLLVLVVGFGLAGAFLVTREPTYQARATVLVASQRISEDFVQSTVVTDQLEKVNAILGELLSRRNLAAMIEEHGLFPDEPGSEKATMEEKVAALRNSILIGPDSSRTGPQIVGSTATVFEVMFTYTDRFKAAAVANDLATGFTDIHLRIRSRQARLTTEFLRRELRQTEEELAAQERAITEFKQRFRGQLPDELAMNMSRLDRLQAQRQSLALQIASAESRLATLAASGSDVEPDSQAALLRSLQNRYKEQLALYTEDHPNLVALRNQIAVLEGSVREASGDERSPAAGSAQIELAELRRQLAETVAEYQVLDQQVALVPQRAEELAAMEQRAEILRESHREFLRKVNQAELSEAVESAQQGERATVLDPAVPPTRPESSPLLILIVLVVGSVGASVAVAVLLELIDAVVVNVEELEHTYRLPVLGSVARIG